MAALIFKCPVTQGSIDCGIESDAHSLKSMSSARLILQCTHCGGSHEFQIQDGRLKDHRLAAGQMKR
jgi:hypothetical protein